MKVLTVVQRYGPDIAGGAEQLVRQLSERMVRDGHHVEVLTSTARNYTDWAPAFAAGTTVESGVTVHRLDARPTRDGALFNAVHHRAAMNVSSQRFASVVSDDWARRLGPDLIGIEDWLLGHHDRFDVAWFSGYMYATTTTGLPLIAPFLPTALQPVAHDEPALHLPSIARVMQHAAGLNFLTPEESDLVLRRFRCRATHRIIGAGITAPPRPYDRSILSELGLEGRPYVVCVGRIDPGKGTLELMEMFRQFRRRHDDDVRLVLVGEAVQHLEPPADVIVTGYLSEARKWALIDGASVLIQPSFNESFSLSLVEGWHCGIPALVQRGSAVLAGQVRRSGGGYAYSSFSEFAAALSLFLDDAELGATLGDRGRRYAEQYEWQHVVPAFTAFLDDTIAHHAEQTVSR